MIIIIQLLSRSVVRFTIIIHHSALGNVYAKTKGTLIKREDGISLAQFKASSQSIK